MFTMAEKRRILRADIPVSRPQELTRPIYDKVRDQDDVTKMQYLDINVWLAGDILLKADRMSMANSLELRVPFLDKKVFEVASRLPRRLRVNSEDKYYQLVKEAFQSATAGQFFNTGELVALLDDHRAGKHDNSRKIWTIYIFLVWYDIYFNGASHEPGDLPAVS